MRCTTRLPPRVHHTVPDRFADRDGLAFFAPLRGLKRKAADHLGTHLPPSAALGVDAIWRAILDSHPMDSQGGPSMRPRVTGSNHQLPFQQLSAKDFERLCLWLVAREGYEKTEWLGAGGNEQGRDLAAWREGVQVVFQCKRVQQLGPKDITAEIEKLLDLSEAERPDEVIFIVSRNVTAGARAAARKAWGEKATCSFWSGGELDEKVKRHPDVVQEFFQIDVEDLKPSSYRCMAQPPERFIDREELQQMVDLLLSAADVPGSTVAITTALRGAGGFGKTTLAQALCHDPRVQEAYPDGVLWVTMGDELREADRLDRVQGLIHWWSKERPAFKDLSTAAAHLREMLADLQVLLVVDDVWANADLQPFHGLGAGSAVLVTTRNSRTLPPKCQRIEVDAMQQSEAVQLLADGLEGLEIGDVEGLAGRLGEWPLLLNLVNRYLLQLVEEDGLEPPEALREVAEELKTEGLEAFDVEDEEGRQWAVGRTLAVSLQRLSADEQELFRRLAVFPEDAEVPLGVVRRLWGLKQREAKRFASRLLSLSLLLRFDRRETLRLHDVVRTYLIDQQRDAMQALHARLLQAVQPASGRWADLRESEQYLWRNLGYHLTRAGEGQTFHGLLFDFDYLQGKLEAADVNALLADYSLVPEDKAMGLVESTLRLSSHVLSKSPEQLAGQLLGRLLGMEDEGILGLLKSASGQSSRPWLRPRTSSLLAAGGALVRTLEGHEGGANAVAVLPDGRVVSGSSDNTLRVWDLTLGESVQTLEGHTDWVRAVAVLPDGRVVSGSSDNTLRVWDLALGESVQTLEGHTDWVRAVAVLPDGRVVSGSSDNTLRVWDLALGESVQTLEGHTSLVLAVAVLPDGRVVSGSSDNTLRVWDLALGESVQTLEGHTSLVLAVAVLPDGRVVSGSDDNTLRVWDLALGESVQTLEGHTDWVRAVAVLPDGRVVSGSSDNTLRVWDLALGESVQTLEGHTDWVRAVAVLPDGRVVSGSDDNTLRVWDPSSGHCLAQFTLDAPVECLCIANRILVAGDHSGRLHFLDLVEP